MKLKAKVVAVRSSEGYMDGKQRVTVRLLDAFGHLGSPLSEQFDMVNEGGYQVDDVLTLTLEHATVGDIVAEVEAAHVG